MQKSGLPFKIIEIDDEKITLEDHEGEMAFVEIHHRIDDWSFMQTVDIDGEAVAVFESHGESDGRIIYMSAHSVIAEFPKTLEPTRIAENSCYLGRTLTEVM